MRPDKSATRIKANPDRLVPTNSYGRPSYYEDTLFQCADCKSEVIFTAKEQRAWYEEYQIPHYAVRIRCQDCQAKHKKNDELRQRFETLQTSFELRQANSRECLEYAQTAIEFSDVFGAMKYVDAVAALKRAIRRDPRMLEGYYWLGRAYEGCGNTEKASASYQTLLDRVPGRKGIAKTKVKEAERRLRHIVSRDEN